MKDFEKYILKTHPDPDSLLKDIDIYNQFVRLSEDYADEQLKLNGVGVRSEQLPCKNEYAREVLEDALYKTGRFTKDNCTQLMEGLMMYINDANLHFTNQGN